jgi:hypothetical protein
VKDNRWLPVIMPLVVFAIVAIVLIGLGMTLLQIALTTGEWFHAPYPHSMLVIVVALAVGGLITLACWLYSRPPGGRRASD